MDEKYVIFAPHVDDEVIGCFRQLEAGVVERVYYFYELTDNRKAEAIECGKKFKFTPIFANSTAVLQLESHYTILAPNILDAHPHHKVINKFAKSYPNKKKYYSVDMNGKFEVLSLMEQIRKKGALFSLFPSQQSLFSDQKYFLFESLVDTDLSKMIWVTFQRAAIHRYPQAGVDESLRDVQYLGNAHRHLFKFKVSIEVGHADREIEFHQFLNWLESLYDKREGMLQLDYKSCEMVADDLATEIGCKYPGRKLVIDISEDGECGCTCEYQT